MLSRAFSLPFQRTQLLLALICVGLALAFWQFPETKSLFAGIALFLLGMTAMENGFKAFTGGILEAVLTTTTNRLWKSLSFGVITTTLMQSSSLVSVITISFISAGLLQLSQGIGIVFGANLGTTTGAWLVSAFGMKVNIAAYAMPLLVFGVLFLMQRGPRIKGVGNVLMGVGFLFFGIHLMKEGFESFQNLVDLTHYRGEGLWGLLVYIAIGILATVLMQSSHATLVITITALASQQVSYENALGLAIGANIGTTITAIIGSLNANIAGKRLAAAHLLFNLTTALIAVALLQPLLKLVDISADWLGIRADDYTLHLSLFHTYFNLLGVLVMLPWIHRLEDMLCRTLRATPDRRGTLAIPPQLNDMRDADAEPKFITSLALNHADAALNAMIEELDHLYDNTYGVIVHGLALERSNIDSTQLRQDAPHAAPVHVATSLDQLYLRYQKPLYAALLKFSITAANDMNEAQKNETFSILAAARGLIGATKHLKHLQKNLLKLTEQQVAQQVRESYFLLRADLAELLWRIQACRQARFAPDELDIPLADLRLFIAGIDKSIEQRLNALLLHNEFDTNLAASFANDAHYGLRLCSNLVDALEVLLTASASGSGVALREQGLTESEIEVIAAQQQEPAP